MSLSRNPAAPAASASNTSWSVPNVVSTSTFVAGSSAVIAPGGRDAVQHRHPDVEHRHVGAGAVGLGDRALAVADLGDDDEVVAHAEHRDDAVAHQLLVLRDQDPGSAGHVTTTARNGSPARTTYSSPARPASNRAAQRLGPLPHPGRPRPPDAPGDPAAADGVRHLTASTSPSVRARPASAPSRVPDHVGERLLHDAVRRQAGAAAGDSLRRRAADGGWRSARPAARPRARVSTRSGQRGEPGQRGGLLVRAVAQHAEHRAQLGERRPAGLLDGEQRLSRGPGRPVRAAAVRRRPARPSRTPRARPRRAARGRCGPARPGRSRRRRVRPPPRAPPPEPRGARPRRRGAVRTCPSPRRRPTATTARSRRHAPSSVTIHAATISSAVSTAGDDRGPSPRPRRGGVDGDQHRAGSSAAAGTRRCDQVLAQVRRAHRHRDQRGCGCAATPAARSSPR